MMIINTNNQHLLRNLLGSILAGLLLLSLVNNTLNAKETGLDKIVAIVNDDVVMFSEIKPIILRMKQSGQTQGSDKSLVKEVLDKVILDKVQLQHAKRVGISVKEETLDKAMSAIASQNKLSLAQLKIALKNEGLNYKQFRDNLRRKLTIDALQKSQQGGKLYIFRKIILCDNNRGITF